MFEDLVSVYRNFLGQRSGSVSQSLRFLTSLSFSFVVLLPSVLFYFCSLVFHALCVSVSWSSRPSRRTNSCLSSLLLRQSGSKDEVFLFYLINFVRFFDSSIRFSVYWCFAYTRLNGLVLRGRPCHVSAPFRLSWFVDNRITASSLRLSSPVPAWPNNFLSLW